MSTIVSANTFAYTVAYITDKMLRSLQLIIRLSGLDPSKFAGDWPVMELGIRTWLSTHDLTAVYLEIFDSRDQSPVGRWDFDILYGYDADGDGGMWVDTDAIRYAIAKTGCYPSQCAYRILVITKNKRPDVPGWDLTTLRSTDGFVRYSIGTTIGAAGAGTGTAYWRKA